MYPIAVTKSRKLYSAAANHDNVRYAHDNGQVRDTCHVVRSKLHTIMKCRSTSIIHPTEKQETDSNAVDSPHPMVALPTAPCKR